MSKIIKPEMVAIQQKKMEIDYGVKSNQNLTVKDVDLSKRIVTGFYNTNFYFDSDQDVSLPGSNSKSINERGPESNSIFKIKHLNHHNWQTSPGVIQVLEERTMNVKGMNLSGTYFETKMTDTTLGNDTLINYQEGVIDNHSFGFRYMDIEYIDVESEKWNHYLNKLINPEDANKYGYMFLMKENKMFEGSGVGIGANILTPFLGVKSGNPEALKIKVMERFALLQKQLKSGLQSDETMQNFEMELLQLKQICKELFIDEKPSDKSTLIDRGRNETDTFDLDKAIREFKLF